MNKMLKVKLTTTKEQSKTLLETMEQFNEACNWISVGITQGRGKKDVFKQFALPVEDVFLYPLRKDFRQILSSPQPY